ncbi:MAG: hypothetical protein Q8M31_12640 [Beijerinckiaceae bacterium]|nr:hypothetical protein [Beijerinckiaceae bacterium]
MTAKDEGMPALGESWGDRGVALTKGILGAVPVAGSIIAEVVGLLIPNQRFQRLEDFVRKLDERLKDLTKEELTERLGNVEGVDLFEEGVLQASRALSRERLDYIANVVVSGITGDNKAKIEAKRILGLLREIDDDQIIILASNLYRFQRDEQFHATHSRILTPVSAHMGSDRDELDADAVFQLARAQLLQLGLLKNQYRKPAKGALPEFDEATGTMKVSSRTLTPIGRLLLRRIGIAGPDDV